MVIGVQDSIDLGSYINKISSQCWLYADDGPCAHVCRLQTFRDKVLIKVDITLKLDKNSNFNMRYACLCDLLRHSN